MNQKEGNYARSFSTVLSEFKPLGMSALGIFTALNWTSLTSAFAFGRNGKIFEVFCDEAELIKAPPTAPLMPINPATHLSLGRVGGVKMRGGIWAGRGCRLCRYLCFAIGRDFS